MKGIVIMSFYETTLTAILWNVLWSLIAAAAIVFYLKYQKRSPVYKTNTLGKFALLSSLIFLGISVAFLILMGLLYIVSNLFLY